MLGNSCLEHTEVAETAVHKSELPATRTSTETTTTVTPPLPDLVPIPPDLVLRDETHAIPQSIVIEPVAKSHVQFTLTQVDDKPQLNCHRDVKDVDNLRQTTESHQQNTNEINVQSCMQIEGFACLMFEEAWSDAMRKVCEVCVLEASKLVTMSVETFVIFDTKKIVGMSSFP